MLGRQPNLDGRRDTGRIVFVINSVGRGGAEPSLFRIIEHLIAQRYPAEIHLVLLDRLEEARPTPKGVFKHVLNSEGSLIRSLRELNRILTQIKPQLVVSFLIRANICNALLSKFFYHRTVICERMHLSSHLQINYFGARLLFSKLIVRISYPIADQVIGVSNGVTLDLIDSFGVKQENALTLVNSYDLDRIRMTSTEEPEIPLPRDFIISVGRLVRNKNYSQLITAFADQSCNEHLIILGEGEERAALQELIETLNLADRVTMAGHIKNPAPIVRRAKYFISSSLNEGFPNAMVEAMILGVPIVASNCPSGPAEILEDNAATQVRGAMKAKYGVLLETGSVTAIREGMAIMSDDDERLRYAAAATQRAMDFGGLKILEIYEQMFRKITDRTPLI